MDRDQLLVQLRRLHSRVRPDASAAGVLSETIEFLRIHTDHRSAFIAALQKLDPRHMGDQALSEGRRHNLESVIALVEAGAHEGMSPRRQAELDVVSDFLGMAHDLLESPEVHPAAAAVLVGATLEEFLRNWIEAEGIDLGTRKPCLESYSAALRQSDLISKQDAKDITSWAGIRNHAAHGEWEAVRDKQRVLLMLEGVNLLIRQRSPSK